MKTVVSVMTAMRAGSYRSIEVIIMIISPGSSTGLEMDV